MRPAVRRLPLRSRQALIHRLDLVALLLVHRRLAAQLHRHLLLAVSQVALFLYPLSRAAPHHHLKYLVVVFQAHLVPAVPCRRR